MTEPLRPFSVHPPEQALRAVLSRVAAEPGRVGELLEQEAEPLMAFSERRAFLAANAAAERFFGYGRGELDGRPTDEIVPQRFRQPDAPPPRATADLTTVEIPGLCRDGTEIPSVWTYGFAPGPDGPIFVLLVQDRRRLAREEESLRRSDARYKSLLLASAAIVWIADDSGDFVERQPAWEAYTGQAWETYRGAGWLSAIHPDDRAQVSRAWQDAVRSGAALYRTQGRVWSAQHGAWRAFQSRGVPVRTAAGEIVEWVGALTDVQDAMDALDRHARRERELEDRFRAVYENALDGIMLMNDELRIVDANPAACRLLERSREQLVGELTSTVMPPPERADSSRLLGEFRAVGKMTGEGGMLMPDGSVRRAEFGAVADVSPGLHLSVFRDIEARKRADDAQRFLDEASRLLVASLDLDETLAAVARLAVPRVADWVAVDMLEPGGAFRRVAVAHVDPRKVELVRGLRRRQAPSIEDPRGIGAVVRDGKPELVEAVTDELLERALAGDPGLLPAVRELGLVSGMTVPISARGRAIGAITLASAESRRRYEPNDLAVAEELARRAGYAVETALLVRDLRAANQVKDLFLRRAEHLVATANELVRAESVAEVASIFESEARPLPLDAYGSALFLLAGERLELVAASGTMRETAMKWAPLPLSDTSPLTVAARRGEAVWLADLEDFVRRFPNLATAPLRQDIGGRASIPLHAAGECIGVLGVTFRQPHAFDAGERAYLTAVANLWGQALRRARLAAAEREAIERALAAETLATRKKDEFLAMLGHELRNPLAPIVTATSLIRARGRVTTRELDILDRQAQHLVRLVDDLLDISRITSGKLSLKRTRLELAEVLAQAIESTFTRFEEKNVGLDTRFGGVPMLVDGDRERLVQVVTNVLANAAKFSPSGTSVFLSAAVVAGEAVVEVRDEGQGIEPELLPHVFDLFTQGQQASDRRTGGLGLGLAIARSIVTAHGGHIEAESAGSGQGATLRLRLPLSTSTHAAVASNGAEHRPQGVLGRRVLIVDDNADSAEMLAAFLSDAGYDCAIAADGARALALCTEQAPDAAILDIGLPDVDGYELAARLTEALGGRAPTLIALTGYAQQSDRARSLERGFVAHLAKPVDMKRLSDSLHASLAPRQR